MLSSNRKCELFKHELYTSYSVPVCVCVLFVWASVREIRSDRASVMLNICAILWQADLILSIIICVESGITRTEGLIAQFFVHFSMKTLKRS